MLFRSNGYPGTPNIVFDSLNHVLSTDTTAYTLQWYFNNSPISGGTTPTYTVTLSGDYFVVAINASGCVAFSDTVTAIYCSGAAAPITVNNNVLSTTDTTSNTFQWYNSTGPIAGATNSFYVATLEDAYHVVVTDEFGCTYTSNSVNIVLAINENEWAREFTLYPNPGHDAVTLTWEAKSQVDFVRLTDIMGKTISTYSTSENKLQMNVEGLQNGIYLLEISGGGRKVTKRLVKE